MNIRNKWNLMEHISSWSVLYDVNTLGENKMSYKHRSSFRG